MRIILVGFGVVGQNLAKLLLSRTDDVYARYGMKPRIVAAIDSRGAAVCSSGLDLQRLLEVKRLYGTVGVYNDEGKQDEDGDVVHTGMDAVWRDRSTGSVVDEIIRDMDAEVLVEATPTNLRDGEPGLSNIITAIKHGKSVVTVNKGPLALAMPSLLELAEYNGVMLRFSGTVGGGTPILEFARHCLKGDRILSFRGILNGTTNYILSMMEEGLTFDDALEDARRKGYAEADPSLDVDGYDAAAKLAIMANWIMGMKVTIRDVRFRGIRDVSLDDILEAKSHGSVIKLLASCDESRRLSVEPMRVEKSEPLCVNGTLNAVTFKSEHSGELTVIGKGAGGMETASAILRDLIEVREAMSVG
ncbi:MAG: homoserine dehydrogenase [Candidatus Nitrosocaldus sp.]|nr:homoserine dehydrogenase [Candidatus Nitrosocaldus sp.]MDW7999547.1 homoserine dehydrogenase [Candidatus Nitrosocaldus sp.]